MKTEGQRDRGTEGPTPPIPATDELRRRFHALAEAGDPDVSLALAQVKQGILSWERAALWLALSQRDRGAEGQRTEGQRTARKKPAADAAE